MGQTATNWFAGLTDKKRQDPTQQYESGMRDLFGEEQEAAGVARDRQQSYDPYAAAAKAAKAQYGTFDRDLRENIEDLRGSQVGTGRLRTGFGYEDQDRLYRGAIEDMNNEIGSRSMQAAGLDLRNIEGMQMARPLAGELGAGGLDYEMAKKDFESKKKGGLLGGIGGLIGGGIGFLAGGGPLGAAVGSQMGGNLFRGIFS